jgi:hypothetical protein
MKRNAILSILLYILLIATACNASLAGGESGSIALTPFSSEEYGVKGAVPVACEQGAPGEFDCRNLRSGQSPVFLILQLYPMTMDEFMPLLVTDLNLTTVPSSRGTFRGTALTWERYYFETPLPELGPEIFRLDLALAEHDSAKQGSIIYAVALLTLPDDYDPHRAFYETVLRHVAYALAPLE